MVPDVPNTLTARHTHMLPEQTSRTSLSVLLDPEARRPFVFPLPVWGPLGSKQVTMPWKESHVSNVFQHLWLFSTHHWGSGILNRDLRRKGPLWRHLKSARHRGEQRKRGRARRGSSLIPVMLQRRKIKWHDRRRSEDTPPKPGCDSESSSTTTSPPQRIKELREA